MKIPLLSALALLSAVVVSTAEPKEEIAAAAKKLGEQSYAWKSTVVVPESVQFRPGPTEGKTDKDGFTHVTMSFGDNVTEVVMKGEKGVVTDQDGNWQLASELENEEGRGRFLGRMVRNMKAPAGQVIELLEHVKDLKKEGDVYTGTLTEEGVKGQYRFGQPQNPKGAVKVWVKDGVLSKYEMKLEAKLEFNGNEFDGSRTTTTEISGVGSTKVNVPEAAKKKLS